MDRSHGRIGHASRPGVADRAPERLVRRRARVPRRREALRRPSMVHARLAIKIGLLIVVVLIIGFGASMLVTIQRESVALIDQNKIGARRLTMAVVASVEGAMLQERPDVTRTMIQQLKSSSLVEGFTIYRRNGVEAFTDLATAGEVERRAGLAPDVLAKITKMQRAPGAPMTGPFFALHYPIPNREACQGCHGSDHTVRAVVRVEASMEPVYAEVRRLRNRQILIGVLTIVSAAIVLTVAMRSVIVRPIEALAAAARRVGEGDFAVRAPAGARDEIGELGAAFNEMTGRLARAHEDLGAENTELESALRNLQESRARLELLEQLKGELSKFVPDAVKKLLEQNPNATELEKKSVDVSVLFLDIAGYTKLSEQLDPKKLNQLVQTYFTGFLEIIQAHHGDVNETAGDGLMVIFQADRAASDHALNASRAAFAIRQRTEQLNEEYGGVFPPIMLHMGINTGEALVGATKLGTGAAQRWTFTATGPTTNVAARFAGSAQGGEIVVGPTTAERMRHHFVLESLGEKTFKNVSQPIHVYRVIPPGIYEKIA